LEVLSTSEVGFSPPTVHKLVPRDSVYNKPSLIQTASPIEIMVNVSSGLLA